MFTLRARAHTHTDSGHIGMEFNPTVRVILGSEIRSMMPRWSVKSGKPFMEYTVPAYELRRLLDQARATNESFSLHYDRLPGVTGNETWRKTAVASQVRLQVINDKQIETCRSRKSQEDPWGDCAPDEVALLPPPSGLLAKVLVWFPYPVVPELDGTELHPCID